MVGSGLIRGLCIAGRRSVASGYTLFFLEAVSVGVTTAQSGGVHVRSRGSSAWF